MNLSLFWIILMKLKTILRLPNFGITNKNPDTDLEERFADTIKDAIAKLQKNPFIYYPIFENVRVAHPKFFPYGVHFIINEDKKEILIVAILHNKQDKSKIIKRL